MRKKLENPKIALRIAANEKKRSKTQNVQVVEFNFRTSNNILEYWYEFQKAVHVFTDMERSADRRCENSVSRLVGCGWPAMHPYFLISRSAWNVGRSRSTRIVMHVYFFVFWKTFLSAGRQIVFWICLLDLLSFCSYVIFNLPDTIFIVWKIKILIKLIIN